MSEWVAFWIFMSVLVYVDYKIFVTGRDGWFHQHNTPQEKAIQQAVIDNLQQKNREGKS
jgi:hypothetical protein